MLARYGIVPRAEIVREVILSGTPSHVVNLAAFIRWLVAAAVIVVGFMFALNRWPVRDSRRCSSVPPACSSCAWQ